MLKIWGRPNSVCTQRVLWVCAEAGLEFEMTLASATMGPEGHVSGGNAAYGIVDSPEYYAMNPNRSVPTIDDEGFVLWESNAILGYLASTHASGLSGSNPETVARASQWMSWTNEHLEPPLHVLVMQLVRLAESQRTPSSVESARQAILPWLAILDEHLAHQPYVAGETFTIGDIPAAIDVYRWVLFDLDGPVMPNLDAWLERLRTREGFRRHVEPREFHLG